MISRRRAIQSGLVALALAMPAGHVMADAPPKGAVTTIQAFYAQLSATMKNGPSLGFSGRRDRLEGAVKRAFDLPQMTRLAVGPRWRTMSPQQQSELIAAFGDYSAATYASRFTHDNGLRFEVNPAVTTSQDGIIVHTQLAGTGDAPVQLDYLMKANGGGWKIEDVYLSGTISELATRRSEFTAVLDRGGPQALVDALRKKASADQG
ncbi:MAG TPA: ABC transporter substrate-binding protein [Stellaceae bacterium]|jgi:phospholipid transport system substrate-binding protein|nr:ABC transporter substrate-binding protein [Stellaceae bacterium]